MIFGPVNFKTIAREFTELPSSPQVWSTSMALTLNKNSASEHMVLQNPMIALIQNGMQWAVVHFQTQRV